MITNSGIMSIFFGGGGGKVDDKISIILLICLCEKAKRATASETHFYLHVSWLIFPAANTLNSYIPWGVH